MPSVYVTPRLRDPKQPEAGVLQVRRENGKPIEAAGATVELSPYIRRRLRDGDLIRGEGPKAKAAEKPGAKPTAKTSDQEG